MNEEQYKRFEKSFLMSKKFLAFLLTLVALTGIAAFLIWKMASAAEMGMWTAVVLTTDIVALAFVSLAFNVKQAALDSAVRLASILGDKFSLDRFKGITGQ